MNIYPIDTGNFKLDGGAMFGVVPKSIWQRTNPADNNNMCSWSMRCMLIEDGDRLMLVDTGIGDKQSEKFFSYYYLFGDATLQKSIETLGFSMDDLTDVFLTHLHFDHMGPLRETEKEIFVRLLKMQPTGAMNDIGNGQRNPTRGKKLLF